MQISADTARDELSHLNVHCLQNPFIAFGSKSLSSRECFIPGAALSPLTVYDVIFLSCHFKDRDQVKIMNTLFQVLLVQ